MPGIHYLDQGNRENPALVLIHSGGISSEEWKDHIPELAKQFRVIAPDMPGHGRSLLGGDQLRIREIGQAMLDLLDELQIEKAHVLGSSLGGATALWMALNHPARILKLVLYRVSYSKGADQFKETQAIANPERWERMGLARWLSKLHLGQGGPDAWKEVVLRVAQAMEPGTTDHNHGLSDLATIPNTTLVIVGDRDPLVPLHQAVAMAETIPDAALWVLPGATHITATNTWRRKIFDQEVERFLRRGLASRPQR
jgi:3-oxoadipate enol-lactonase